MSPQTIVVGTFLAVLAMVFVAYWLLVVNPEQSEQRALHRRMKAGSKAVKSSTPAPGGLVQEQKALSNLPAFDTILRETHGLTAPLQRMIDQSGLQLTLGSLLLLCACAGAVGFIAVSYFARVTLLALAAAAICTYIPIGFVKWRVGRRIAKFEEQFPEAIDLLSRALKAGHAFTTGLSMVANEMPEPVGTEFRLAYDRQNFGMPLPQALKSLADRVPLLDAKFFVTAVLTQRDAGGNLSEVLDNLSKVIRERFKVKRQVRVITAHARLTGWVLACLPPAVALALFVISPEHMSTLWTDPLGVQLIVLGLVLQVVGSLVIRKLVNIEY
jgi:tight adherence protein B